MFVSRCAHNQWTPPGRLPGARPSSLWLIANMMFRPSICSSHSNASTFSFSFTSLKSFAILQFIPETTQRWIKFCSLIKPGLGAGIFYPLHSSQIHSLSNPSVEPQGFWRWSWGYLEAGEAKDGSYAHFSKTDPDTFFLYFRILHEIQCRRKAKDCTSEFCNGLPSIYI